MSEFYNRDIELILQKLDDVATELKACQSSRLHVGMTDFDVRRLEEELMAILAHAKAVKPTDFPETHPVQLGNSDTTTE